MSKIVTGIKPTGTPHLGNFFGMIRPALHLATEHDAYYFVADLHALNTAPHPDALRRNTIEAAAIFLALGLDPERSVLYRQSDVPEVCELAQLLAAVTPKGLLNRAHAYKAATSANRERGLDTDDGVNMGLYGYPLLMAADILALGADLVPVGRDQRQHLEITRDIAVAFNAAYEPIFGLPEAVVDDSAEVVPGVDGRKMSKSNDNTIPILAEPEAVRRAVMSIVTDARPIDEPKDPDGDVIFQLFQLVAADDEVEALAARYRAGGLRYADAKRLLAEALIDRFAEPRVAYRNLVEEPAAVDAVLVSGAEVVRTLAAQTLARVHSVVGMSRRRPIVTGAAQPAR
jgi:tryptophanyl-tRNA synthetase